MGEERVSKRLADAFAAQGISRLFGILGDANIAFMVELAACPGVRSVHTRHESNAVAMAAGYARYSGSPAVACLTSGPGLTHATTSIISACRARVPLIVYAGDTAQGGSFMGGLQEFDHEQFAALTGAIYFRVDGRLSPERSVAEAVALTSSQRRPVLFSVPVDYLESRAAAVPADPAGPEQVAGAYGDRSHQPSRDHTGLARLREAVAAAKSPLLVAGSGAVAAGAVESIRALAHAIDARLGTTFRAKGCFDDDPRSVGIIGALSHVADQEVIEKADLVVGFGADLDGFGAFGSRLLTCETFRVGEELYGGGANAGNRVAESIESVLAELCGQHAAGSREPEVDRAEAEKARAAAVLSDLHELPEVHDDQRVDPRRLMLELDELLPDDCVVVVGAGHFWSFPIMYLSKKARDFVFPIEFGSIGMALSTGIGIAAGDPGRQVVVVEGDGGVLMGVQELETACRHDIQVTVVVMNDGALGAEYHKLVAKGLPGDDAAYEDVDFGRLAESFGGWGTVLRSSADVRAAFTADGPPGSVTVLDARVSRGVTSRWYRRLYL